MSKELSEGPALDFGNPAPDDVPLILETIKIVAPLEAEVVGERTMSSIAAGASFGTVDGGRHLNLHQVLADVSALVAITHAVISAARWLQTRSQNANRTSTEGRVEQISNIVLAHPSTQMHLKTMNANDPAMLHQIIQTVRSANPSLF